MDDVRRLRAKPIALVVTMVAAALGCSSLTPDVGAPQSITLSPPVPGTFALYVGTPLQLNVTVRNAAGDSIPYAEPIDFASRDTAKVTIDAHARVFARSVGKTYVVASLRTNGRVLIDSLEVLVIGP